MLHGIVGHDVMPVLGLILLIVSFFAAKSVPGARKWGGIVFGLIVLQVALAFVAFSAAGHRRPARPQRAAASSAPPAARPMLAREDRRPAARAASRCRASVPSTGSRPGVVAPCLAHSVRRLAAASSRSSSSSSLLGYLGWSWWSSLVPSTYSVMEMGHADYGGGPGATTHAHRRARSPS